MGCISSKLLATTDLDGDLFFASGRNEAARDSFNHVVSLTSSTYGALNLDPEVEEEAQCKRSPPQPCTLFTPQFKRRALKEEPAEIINTWELMKDLDDETPVWSPATRPTKASPKPQKKKPLGKENYSPREGLERCDFDPNRVFRPLSSSANKQQKGSISIVRKTPIEVKIQKTERDGGLLSSRRSLSPLFDPELVAAFERELYREGEQIKLMVPATARNQKARELDLLIQSFEEKCPPGGENDLVLYTTTLRGIRKTFEDCNAVRNAMESYGVRLIERDISMDSGFREELRVVMGMKEVRLPVVFVKGRLIGGAEEVLRLEEEGKLGLLLDGIPKAATCCGVCGGVRFVMCMDCDGSCKVLDGKEKKMVKCGGCNENGLIHCPMCC